ncbi:MAG: CsgG/HfaB family protein [Candidatus Acidiferrales bacterium]
MTQAVKFFSFLFAIAVALQFPYASHVTASPQTSTAHETKKKIIAVLDFDDTAVGTAVLGDQVDVGKAISALLAQQLAKEGTYAVVDSKTTSQALAELNFSKSDRTDREFAVKLGKRLGADGVIMGAVTLFGKDLKARPIPSDEMIPRKIKARVEAEARIVDVGTDMIVAMAGGRGESKRQGVSLMAGGNWHGFSGGNVDFGSSEFQATILGEAVDDAVQQLTTALAANASRLAPPQAEITGLVVSVNGAEIVLNIGAKAGLKLGDELAVERIVRDIPDPANGELSRLITSPIGMVRIAEFHDAFSVATKISGDGEIKIGDHVKAVLH